MPRLVFNLSLGRFRVSGNAGVSFEQATYNGQRETYFFPKTYMSGDWNFNSQQSLSFSFEYSMFGNSLGKKSPNIIMTDQFTAIKGNSELKNYHFISPTVSYNIIPNKRASFNAYARWQYFDNPSTYIWEPMKYNGSTVVVRSYTNAGYLSDLHYGISGTLKLFDNNLYLNTTLSQHYFKQSGPSEIGTWPLSVRCQVNWYIKNLAVSASWEKSTKYVSIFQTRKWPQNYFVALTYGNGNFVA
jgi:hypothetical protein